LSEFADGLGTETYLIGKGRLRFVSSGNTPPCTRWEKILETGKNVASQKKTEKHRQIRTLPIIPGYRFGKP